MIREGRMSKSAAAPRRVGIHLPTAGGVCCAPERAHVTLGIPPFRRLLNDPRFAHAAFIAETPVDQPDDDLRNVSVLRSLIARSTSMASYNR
jgi:hypothetical protein